MESPLDVKDGLVKHLVDENQKVESDLTRHKEMLRELAEEMKEAVAGRDQWRNTQLENIDLKSKLDKAVKLLTAYRNVCGQQQRQKLKQFLVEYAGSKEIGGVDGKKTVDTSEHHEA